jgi:multicomponent Na+:H+ antiporter subunit D
VTPDALAAAPSTWAQFPALAVSHAPAVVVAAPLVAALAVLMTPGPRWALALALLGAGIACFAAAVALIAVMANGPVAYTLTAGLAWRIDAWSAGIVAMSFGLAFPVLVAGGSAALRQAQTIPPNFALAAALSMAGAMAAAAFSAHLALLALGLQAAGLSLCVLVAAGAEGQTRPSLNAALRVLAAFGVAGAVVWFGVGLVFAGTGEGDPTVLAGIGTGSQAALAGLVLVALGTALAGLLAPLDHWGAAVLTRGPLLAGLAALTFVGPLAFAAVARTMSFVADLGAGLAAGVMLIVLGAAGTLAAAIQALAARDLRRLAGYAYAAQLGCALVGLALSTPEGAAAAALKVSGATLAGLLLLAAAGVESDIDQLDGLARRAPLAALCALLGCFLLMSAPFTLGYAGSWALVEAFLARGWWAGAALTVAVSLAAVVFGGRLLERIYFRAPHSDAPLARPPMQGLALGLLALLAVAAGFAGGPLTAWADAAGYALWAWPTGAPMVTPPAGAGP